MASQYSHLQFFRRVPNALLARYFDSQHSSLNLDWAKLKETDGEQILAAFGELPVEQQAEIEAQFQDVNALACEGGVAALVDESAFHGDEAFDSALREVDGFHAKVMWAFLEKPTYWRGAAMFLHSDNVSAAYWRKRNDLPAVPPHVDEADIKALAAAISKLFIKEGRGKNCKVEPYRRYDREYFFAYPEDFAQSGVEWVSNTLKTLAHHPAFEIIFVYRASEGSLDIYAPKNTKAVPELQRIFARTILHVDSLADGSIDKRVYELAPMASPDFTFTIQPQNGIESIVVTRIRLTLKHGDKRRITLEADPRRNAKAVYELLEELRPPPYQITQVGLKVTLAAKRGQRVKTRSFNISYPNYCALNHDGTDMQIREVLAASGIEPRAAVGS